MAADTNELPLESRQYHPLVVVERKLGIDFSSLTIILKEAHECFIKLNKTQQRELEEVTRVMVLLKPDNYTAMNRRKDMMLKGYINPKAELALIELIFTVPRHSKSSVAWYHRQWIHSQFRDNLRINVEKEMELCKITAEANPRNYYSWTYRIWILSTYGISDRLIDKEYNDVCQWLTLNISDYSAFQYLHNVIIAHKNFNRNKHTDWINQLIIKYPFHESLWYHKRFCSSLFISAEDYCAQQKQFVGEVLDDKYSNRSLINSDLELTKQKIYAARFNKWLSFVENRHHGVSDTTLRKPDTLTGI
ncbi:hypothetical protein BDF20DRAFT_910694 [Mycotypha africana]|uniref:uncharacterized protein n=1 Tax=Mycotypha africana TaxID=64632 RepID=UPI0022FFDFAB|nr:uncharacterized protein BDF20DRAFT_910694 [Mycotypha africana]KAI8988170.1 hypothetical protein BDF20DRAFT_910694 [Mycotypha africana]